MPHVSYAFVYIHFGNVKLFINVKSNIITGVYFLEICLNESCYCELIMIVFDIFHVTKLAYIVLFH